MVPDLSSLGRFRTFFLFLVSPRRIDAYYSFSPASSTRPFGFLPPAHGLLSFIFRECTFVLLFGSLSDETPFLLPPELSMLFSASPFVISRPFFAEFLRDLSRSPFPPLVDGPPSVFLLRVFSFFCHGLLGVISLSAFFLLGCGFLTMRHFFPFFLT